MKRHINILPNKKKECCGCSACISICPRKCISIYKDSLGFTYPIVDESLCIECGACTSVCPFINPYDQSGSLESFAGENRSDEIRLQSSSGGIFYALATQTIAEGGVVFGAVFDSTWQVIHNWTDSQDGIQAMMGSKYLQSDMGNSFSEARKFLREDRKVLFTGTPCQIAGLKHFLKKDYDNLLTVEVVCHGVPSPSAWNSYLDNSFNVLIEGAEDTTMNMLVSYNIRNIKSINFREKRNGWKNFGLSIGFEGFKQKGSPGLTSSFTNFYEPYASNIYMKAFLSNWDLRPSCFYCKSKNGRSKADITIGDFWGIDSIKNYTNDDVGVSCIVCRTIKGVSIIKGLENVKITAVPYFSILEGNPMLEGNVTETFQSKRFRRIFRNGHFINTMQIMRNIPLFQRIIISLKYRLRKNS